MANMGLGLGFEGIEEIDEAIKWIETALKINSENMAALYTIVKLAHDTADYEKGIFWLNQYLERHPNDPEMLYALSGLHLKSGHFEEVKKIANHILQMDPASQRALTLVKQVNRAQLKLKQQRA